MPNSKDTGLEALLNLDGMTYRLNNGYWVKFEAFLVSRTVHIPHGVSYSLTLHDRHNTRIIGFDNAHAVQRVGRIRFSGRKVTWDHKHRLEKALPYQYASAAQLLEDFWAEVEAMVPID